MTVARPRKRSATGTVWPSRDDPIATESRTSARSNPSTLATASGMEPAARMPSSVSRVPALVASCKIFSRSICPSEVFSAISANASPVKPLVSVAEIEYEMPAITKSKSKFPPSSVKTWLTRRVHASQENGPHT